MVLVMVVMNGGVGGGGDKGARLVVTNLLHL